MKEKKIISHHLFKTKIPLLDEITFKLVLTSNIRSAHSAFKVPFRSDCAENGGECHMEAGSFDVYLFLDTKCITHGWIGHEISHVVNCISGKVGIAPDRDNDEMDARIADFLHFWLYRKLENAAFKVTHKPLK